MFKNEKVVEECDSEYYEKEGVSEKDTEELSENVRLWYLTPNNWETRQRRKCLFQNK